MELLTALAFVAVVLARGVHTELVALIPFTAMLIAVAFIDLQHKIVPNKILLPAAVWGLVDRGSSSAPTSRPSCSSRAPPRSLSSCSPR